MTVFSQSFMLLYYEKKKKVVKSSNIVDRIDFGWSGKRAGSEESLGTYYEFLSL